MRGGTDAYTIPWLAAAGMLAAWVDRSGDLFDTLGPRLDVVVGSLVKLADALEAQWG